MLSSSLEFRVNHILFLLVLFVSDYYLPVELGIFRLICIENVCGGRIVF